MYSVREGGRVSLEARDAGAVVVALEGLEGAALAPVAVGAHEALAADAVAVVLASANVAGALGARLKQEANDLVGMSYSTVQFTENKC